jgi:hypothetical protein
VVKRVTVGKRASKRGMDKKQDLGSNIKMDTKDR